MVQAAADALGLQLQILGASTEGDFDTAFAALIKSRAGGLVISNEIHATRQEKLAAASVRYAVPTISSSREFTAAGGLMSYSGSFTETHTQAGVYTGLILKGRSSMSDMATNCSAAACNWAVARPARSKCWQVCTLEKKFSFPNRPQAPTGSPYHD